MKNMVPADNSKLRDEINAADAATRDKLLSSGWWHSIDLGDGRITPGARSLEELQMLYASFRLPESLRDKRVLDIGCWDGFFSFEAERRGAEVVAIDCWRPQTFFEAHAILNSRVEFREMSVYEITREKLGSFDIVLMLGVLYHLQHPLLALQRVAEVTRDVAIIESHVIDNVVETALPIMEFYEMDELGGQYDNWWGPNTECMIRMLRAAGFVSNTIVLRETARAAIKSSPHFENLPVESTPSIEVLDVVNAFTFERQLPRQGRHAFMTILANGLPEDISREDVKIVAGDYGALPCYVGPVGNPDEIKCQFQINAPVPLGLDLGKTQVQIFCRGSSSNSVTIEVVEGGAW